MEHSWVEYCRQEQRVQQLREALQGQMELCTDPQVNRVCVCRDKLTEYMVNGFVFVCVAIC